MSTPIATVLSVTGQAWARDADGNLRALEPGDVLLEGETLITSDNGRVRLDFGDTEPVAIGPGQAVAMLAELDADNPVPDDEATTTDESVDALLAAIEEGEGDLLEVLDPTAAGLGGGGGGGGNSFVRLARISESVDSLAFDFQPVQLDGLIEAQGESLIDQNEAPIAIDDTGVGQEDTALTGNVLSNDIDDDGDTLTVVGFTINDSAYQAGETAELEGIGSLIVNGDGSYTFTPAENYNGPVPTVTYTVSDGELTDTATLDLTVEAINDAPVAVADTGSGTEDTVLTGNVLENDSDIDGDALTVIDFTVNYPIGQPVPLGDFGEIGPIFPAEQIGNTYQAGETATLFGIGTLTIESDGTYTFTPADDWNGQVPVVTYTITDGEFFDTATLTLNIEGINDTPTGGDDNATDAADDALTTAEDTALTIDAATLLANDDDVDGDTLTITGVSNPQNGTVVLNDNGTITFTPAENYNGPATFDYTVSDGTATDTASVTVAVTPINDTPTGGDDNATDAADDALTTAEDTELVIQPGTLLANDSDMDGDTLTITGVGNASNGTVVLNTDGTITFTPNANYNGQATFDYTVSDGAATDTATVTIEVTPDNDAPVALDDSGSSEEDNAISGNVLSNDSDIDNADSELSVSGFTINQATYQAGETAELEGVGSLVVNSDGSYTFTPVANWNGQVPAVSYTVSDGELSDSATLNLTVEAVNDPLVAVDDTNNIDVNVSNETTGNVLDNDSDTDNDPIQVSQVGEKEISNGGPTTIKGLHGTLEIDSDGGYTYTSNLGTPVLYGFNGSDGQLNGNVLEEFALSSEAQQRISITEDGVGVTGGEQGHPTPDQINETGDVLVADLGTPVSSVTFGVARLFNDESGGESGQWFAYDAQGNLVGSGQFGPGDVAYQDGSNHIGTVTITADDVDGDFQYLAFEGLDYQNGTDNAANDGGDYLVTGITVQDAFDYTIVDGQGGDASATLTIDSSASLSGYQIPTDNAAEPEATIFIDDITDDDTIDFGESQADFITITGSVGGDAREGDTVTLTVGGNDYTGTVDANEKYSIDVPGGILAEFTQINASVSGENAVGNSYSANTTRDYTVDLRMPPEASNDSGKTEENSQLAVASEQGVLANDTDLNEDSLTVIEVNNDAARVGQPIAGSNGGTFTLQANGSYTFDPANDFESLAPGDETTTELTYTVSDGDGGTDTATLTVTITGTNDAPVISGDNSGVVSEEGLANGLADDNGAPDTTNLSTYTGQITVSDIDSSNLSLKLTEPTTELFSNSELVSWEINADGNELIGSAGEKEIIKVSIDNDGSYVVELLGPVDHPVTTSEDTLSFDIGVTVSDGNLSSASTITVTIEDDSPSVTQGETVRATANDIPDTFTGYVSFAGNSDNSDKLTFARGDVEVSGKGFTSNSDLTLIQAEIDQSESGIGIASEASPYHNIANEIGYRETAEGSAASEELTIKLIGGKIAYGAEIDFEKMYGGELEEGVAEFYRDGVLISIQSFSSDENSGQYAANFKVEEGGFDTIVIKASDNGNDYNDGDNSDFTISGIQFMGSDSDQAIAFAKGSLDVDYGADGKGSLALTGIEFGLNQITTTLNDSGTVLTGKDDAGNLVFEINLTPATGAWEYYQYQPIQGGESPISFGYEATDADGDAAAGHFEIALNNVPIANSDINSGNEDSPLIGNVLTNDTDPDGDSLTVTSFTVGGETYNAGETAELVGIGSLAIDSNGSYRFTPANNWNGTVPVITYVANDGIGSSESTLDISIASVNDVPESSDSTADTTEGTPYVFQVSDFAFVDPADEVGNAGADGLQNIIITSLPESGMLLLDGQEVEGGDVIGIDTIAGGKLTFTPDAENVGQQEGTHFSFKVQDDGGVENDGADTSNEYTFTLNVGGLIVPKSPNGDNVTTGGSGGDIVLGDTGGTEKTVEPGKNYNISLIVDTSGSMDDPSGQTRIETYTEMELIKTGWPWDWYYKEVIKTHEVDISRMELVKESLENLAGQLKDHDGNVNVQLVGFSGSAYTATTIQDLNSNNIQTLLSAIEELHAGNGTNYEAAFNEAADWFNVQDNGYENLSFFLTDGKPTQNTSGHSGSGTETEYDDLKNAVSAFDELSSQNVTVHGTGIGDGINKEYLQFFDNTNVSGEGSVVFGTTETNLYNGRSGSDSLKFGESYNDQGQVSNRWNELLIDDGRGDDATVAISSSFDVAKYNSALSFNYIVDGFSSNGKDQFSWRLEKLNNGQWESVENGCHDSSSGWKKVSIGNIDPGEYRFVYAVENNTGKGYDEVYIDNVTLTETVIVTGPVGEVEIVNNASDLGAVLQDGSTSIDPIAVGNDTIDGGKGDDIIFGDTLNTDSLPWGEDGNPAKPADLPDGSGLDALKTFLELKNGDSPTDAELYDYIKNNHEAFNVEGDARGGNDVLSGGESDDILYGQGGSDTLTGGAGNDTLYGGLGADTFAWELGDQGSEASPAQDSVMDFNTDEGDKLDFSELLDGESEQTIGDFIIAQEDEAGNTMLHISSTGNLNGDAANADQIVTLEGVAMNGDSQAFLDDMITSGKLTIDQ